MRSATAQDECARFLDALHPLLQKHGKPEFIRSDNGPEFIAMHLEDWLRRIDIQSMQIYPGLPGETGYNERLNGTLRKEVLNTDSFHTTKHAQVAINAWIRRDQAKPTRQPDQTSSCIKHQSIAAHREIVYSLSVY